MKPPRNSFTQIEIVGVIVCAIIGSTFWIGIAVAIFHFARKYW